MKNLPHFKVRNPLVESAPKGKITRRYVYPANSTKGVLVYEDPKRSPKKKS